MLALEKQYRLNPDAAKLELEEKMGLRVLLAESEALSKEKTLQIRNTQIELLIKDLHEKTQDATNARSSLALDELAAQDVEKDRMKLLLDREKMDAEKQLYKGKVARCKLDRIELLTQIDGLKPKVAKLEEEKSQLEETITLLKGYLYTEKLSFETLSSLNTKERAAFTEWLNCKEQSMALTK